MSWQAYVDSNLLATGKIKKAAIHGLDGNLWATSADFSLPKAEVDTLIKAFVDPAGIRSAGLNLGGTKYVALRADDRSIYAKTNTSGAVCVKTKQAVLIAIYENPVQPGEATKVVEGLADYLIGLNY
ncbi:hypothetical protein CXG81DRAFT_28403 [Caulochytrium protostelioides]|uniref:Profilin n=1 Tax=Caulochytrium protostelioides TaxID=1555241 RepID=A0A4P9X193_9FUNG|nr:hypothetical protein CXG81DRAFT_28403 [Caulochytrium protostelioides]|eukprot:RKO98795.1 hypothetical protein CXG81DRAFT_28403 [Caulochytrium protostelioides]